MNINFTLEEIEKIKENISNFISKMRYYFDEIKKLSSDMESDINDRIRDCLHNIDRINEDIEFARYVLEHNTKQLNRLLEAESRAKQKLETLNKMIRSYNAQFSKLETKYNGYTQKITKIESGKNDKNEDTLSEKLEKEYKAQQSVKSELEVVSKKLKPLEDKKKVIEGCMFAIQREKQNINELIKQVKAIIKDQNNCRDFLFYLKDEMNKFLWTLNDFNQKFNSSSGIINEVLDRIEESFKGGNNGAKNVVGEITDMLDYMIGQEYRTGKFLFFDVDNTKRINVKFDIEDRIIENQKSFTRISEAFENFAEEFRGNISAIEKSEKEYSQNMSDNIQESASELVENVVIQSKEFDFNEISDGFDRLNKYVKEYYNAYDEIRNIYYM